jgi:hypothetical protein
MRRTLLSALALACTAVLASTAPAFADGPTAVPSSPAAAAPTEAPGTPSPGTVPGEQPRPVPSVSSPAPAAEQPAAPSEDGQVSTVPVGAPDTGVTTRQSSGADGTLIGAGAGTVLVAGGAVALVVRRRRATGA